MLLAGTSVVPGGLPVTTPGVVAVGSTGSKGPAIDRWCSGGCSGSADGPLGKVVPPVGQRCASDPRLPPAALEAAAPAAAGR